MGAKGVAELPKYESIAQYADRQGVQASYIRGVILGNKIELSVFMGSQVIDDEARKLLDPIVANIHNGQLLETRGRPRKVAAKP